MKKKLACLFSFEPCSCCSLQTFRILALIVALLVSFECDRSAVLVGCSAAYYAVRAIVRGIYEAQFEDEPCPIQSGD